LLEEKDRFDINHLTIHQGKKQPQTTDIKCLKQNITSLSLVDTALLGLQTLRVLFAFEKPLFSPFTRWFMCDFLSAVK
jgi:hypothetical protein